MLLNSINRGKISLEFISRLSSCMMSFISFFTKYRCNGMMKTESHKKKGRIWMAGAAVSLEESAISC